MRFSIHSPGGTAADHTQVNAVRTILADGKPLTILPRHAPLMAEVGKEAITVITNENEKTYTVDHGILMVAKDKVTILTTGMATWEENDA